MSDNYNPQITQVRQSFDTRAIGPVWHKTDSGDASALLVEGVPMVGERVETASYGKQIAGVVETHLLVLTVKWADGSRSYVLDPRNFRPVTQNAEVEVEAVALYADASGIGAEGWDDLTDFHRDMWRRDARAAIEAIDRVRGRDE